MPDKIALVFEDGICSSLLERSRHTTNQTIIPQTSSNIVMTRGMYIFLCNCTIFSGFLFMFQHIYVSAEAFSTIWCSGHTVEVFKYNQIKTTEGRNNKTCIS